ncbi:LAMI_0D13124g1_1 [Lachancea mirantina]|uniref:LAMI_0D13124g1_1 n=1 Tax=Lachancea mirantina TaxID=1230905 RepID=A0A1G4JG71_9SACH|nr:LAMI_0D13124g1_1 [Lachancea mirantina]
MSSLVTNRSITYINNKSPLIITGEEIDLDTVYSENEVVVEIHAAALNPVDYMLYKFAFPLLVNKQPKKLCMDFSGVIVRRGEKVKEFKSGDKITGKYWHVFGKQGTLSNYLVLDPEKVATVAPSVSFGEQGGEEYDDFVLNAAWPLVFGTALQGLTHSCQKLGPDSRILIIGASTAVGNCAVQIAKNYLKVGTVAGVCSKDSIEYNRAFGFDHLIPYDDGDLVKTTKALISDEWGGGKCDLIFDCVGNSCFFPHINDVLKPQSANSYYVTIVGDRKIVYKAPKISNFFPVWESLRRHGPYKKYNYANIHSGGSREAIDLGNQLISRQEFVPQIDSVWEFDDYQRAFDKLISNRAKGKIVIKVR